MKKIYALPLAALAFTAACDDSPTGVTAVDGPVFAAGVADVAASVSGNSVTISWRDISGIQNPEYMVNFQVVSCVTPGTCDASAESSTHDTFVTRSGLGNGVYTAKVRVKNNNDYNNWVNATYLGGTQISIGSTPSTTTKTAQVITFTSTAPTNAVYGGATYTVTATGGASGNPVTFSPKAGSVCTISGAVVTMAGAGNCTIVASQRGNDNYLDAVEEEQSFTIAQAVLTVTASSGSKVWDGSGFTHSVSYSGFRFQDDANSLNRTGLSFSVAPINPTLATTVYPAPGIYSLTASGLSSSNYSFSYVAGRLEIAAWTYGGFYSPVKMEALNTVKAGSTVPLKFNVFAGGVEKTATSDLKPFAIQQINCVDAAATGAEDPLEFTTTGGTSIRYSGTAGVDGQFIQNWQTPSKAGNCYRAIATMLDGTKISANFKLK